MKPFLLILLLGTIGHCYAGTFSIDTIDNWQVYNGDILVLAGHDSPLESAFSGTIKKPELKDLAIQFNHCVMFPAPFDVVIDFIDTRGKLILTRTFKFRSGVRFVVRKKELEQLPATITLRYRENRKNGADKILGQLNFK